MRHKGGKRKFAGPNMHLEFHTVNPRKGKASNCIYLTEDRECRNKKSPNYLAKCFAASYCTFKEKAKDVTPTQIPPQPPKREERKKIRCSLPWKCPVKSRAFGQGEFTAYDAKKGIIEVTFNGIPRKFVYPDAIINKHLILPQYAFEIVLKDISKEENEK